jgi:hypothetical protein
LKDNAKALLQEILFQKQLGKNEFGVYQVEHIHLLGAIDLLKII